MNLEVVNLALFGYPYDFLFSSFFLSPLCSLTVDFCVKEGGEWEVLLPSKLRHVRLGHASPSSINFYLKERRNQTRINRLCPGVLFSGILTEEIIILSFTLFVKGSSFSNVCSCLEACGERLHDTCAGSWLLFSSFYSWFGIVFVKHKHTQVLKLTHVSFYLFENRLV